MELKDFFLTAPAAEGEMRLWVLAGGSQTGTDLLDSHWAAALHMLSHKSVNVLNLKAQRVSSSPHTHGITWEMLRGRELDGSFAHPTRQTRRCHRGNSLLCN